MLNPHDNLRSALTILAFMAIGGSGSDAFGLDVPVPAAASANSIGQSAQYDTALWTAFLAEHVNEDGLVNYAGAKNDPNLLGFVTLLSQTDPTSMNDSNASKAYWINAYNALAIYAVCWKLPDDRSKQDTFSVIDQPIDGLPPNKGFFEGLEFAVAGQRYSLDEIEKRILLRQWKGIHPRKSSVYLFDAPKDADPRIHFALVCCARGCPRLQREAYDAKRIDAQLEFATKSFLTGSSRSKFNLRDHTWYVSELMQWYESDFVDSRYTKSENSVFEFAANYVRDDSLADSLRSDQWQMSYTKYDWKLNIWHK